MCMCVSQMFLSCSFPHYLREYISRRRRTGVKLERSGIWCWLQKILLGFVLKLFFFFTIFIDKFAQNFCCCSKHYWHFGVVDGGWLVMYVYVWWMNESWESFTWECDNGMQFCHLCIVCKKYAYMGVWVTADHESAWVCDYVCLLLLQLLLLLVY